ncbi:thaumatin-like protein 1b [Silene latifolia]|uniref:thaumatin-like protein 1b n=1 Tax=Silene latifolia TaxID=37657 RepID=UPI003D7747BD
MRHQRVLVLFFILTLTTRCFIGSESTKFIIQNRCPDTIWPATLAGSGTPQLASTGFQLSPGSTTSLDLPTGWSGRLWARTLCSTDSLGKFNCDTGDCGSGTITCNGAGGAPPASLIEFTLSGHNGNDQDFYDISLVDGFNLPISVTPQGGSGTKCNTISCPVNLNSGCPGELALVGAGGRAIGCKSACFALGQPQYCCTGGYGSPSTCPPTVYSKYFKGACPQAYSYAYDDGSSTFTCSGQPDYLITFCP